MRTSLNKLFDEEKIIGLIFPARFPNWKHLAIVLLALAVMYLSSCSNAEMPTDNASTKADSRNTSVVTRVVMASVREVPTYIVASGTFKADETANVAAETSGKISETLVNEGQYVAAGDVLIRLDERDANLRLQQARAAENQAKAGIVQAEAQLRQSQANLGLDKGGNFVIDNIPAVLQARAVLASRSSDLKLAETTERRYSNLLQTGDTSKLVVDQRRNETEKAQAAVNEARENLKAAENAARQGDQAIAADNANLLSARAALDNAVSATALAAKTVSDTTIRSPFSGYISVRSAAVGETVSPSTPIVTIVRISPIKLILQVPEKEAGRVTAGKSVSAAVAAFPDRRFSGQVSAVKPVVNQSSRTLQVEAVFENLEGLLRPGMFSAAKILLPGAEKGIFVPRSSIVTDEVTASHGVYVIDGGVARLRSVQIDESTRDMEEVHVLTGLSTDEKIAATAIDKLFDGVKVIGE